MKYEKRMFALALMLSGAFLFAPRLHAQEAAFFREVTGTVEIKAPGSADWVGAAAGDRIEKNTLISTGFRSTAVIILGDSVIMIRPVTRLSLEEIIKNQNGEEVSLYLQTGRVRADVKPPAGGDIDFTIRSPSVTASVRGTSFEFDTENLRVNEGRVQYFLANGRRVFVSAGGMSYINETNNSLISPFDAAVELLSPALPLGSGSSSPVPPFGNGSGSPTGDSAPALIPPPSGADVGIGFEWD